MSYQNECTGCGLSVHDLPGDPELMREQFFDYADDGSLYCQGCIASGEGAFL